MSCCSSKHHERGAALIIVLGLLALITAWAVEAAYGDMLALRRAENHQQQIQSEQGSSSILALAASILRSDSRDSVTDHLNEVWAQQAPPFSIDDGRVQGEIVDANRYLNLNALVDMNGQPVMLSVMRVKQLFTQLELDPLLVDALVDWLDADDLPFGSGGAESSSYSGSYRIKNGPLDRWHELELIHGFTADVLAKLEQTVIVVPMPTGGVMSVNINTAQMQVLRALSPVISDADVQILIDGRPYASVSEATMNKAWAKGLDLTGLSVISDTFMVRTRSVFGRAELREQFVVRREAGMLTLLSCERMRWRPEIQMTGLIP